jgi:cytochrome b subunit of formate dehydrogenase
MLTKTDIEKYFIAEKQESLLFIGIGIAAMIIALLGIFVWKTQFWRGSSIPFIAIALLQIVVGYTVYTRSDADRIRVLYALDMNPDDLKSKELPRMETVNKNFVVYRYVEIVLLITGIILIALYKANLDKQFIYGIAVALAVQSALMLGADYFAEKRALIYTAQLKATVK